MKKTLSIILAVLMVVVACVACSNGNDTQNTTEASTTATATVDPNKKDEGVLTYAQFVALEKDKDCVIEGFVQAITPYAAAWTNCTFYLADGDGAYYVYRYNCTQEEYDAIKTIGTKVKVEGTKTEWGGETEIAEGTAKVTVVGTDKYIAPIKDVTALVGTDDLAKDNNKFVAIKGAVVTSSSMKDPADSSATLEKAFLYKWDGSGEQGSDIYFNVQVGSTACTFVIETDFADANSAAYKAAEALKIGDTIDLEGFLFWYNAPQMQVTDIKVK